MPKIVIFYCEPISSEQFIFSVSLETFPINEKSFHDFYFSHWKLLFEINL